MSDLLSLFRSILAILTIAVVICFAAVTVPPKPAELPSTEKEASTTDEKATDTVATVEKLHLNAENIRTHIKKPIEQTAGYKSVEGSDMWLSEGDIRQFAEEKGLEVAAVKAIIDIETGRTHKSFWAEGKPLINFDRFVFAKMAKKNNIDVELYKESHPLVFNPAVFDNYSNQQAAEQARLDCALTIDTVTAIEGTFWGMFQIGGFNWKLCKTSSPQKFVELMSRSALDQLELFGAFLESTSLMRHLKAKDWEAFAYRYNGAGYAKHNYHTRLEAAYNRHTQEEMKTFSTDSIAK